MIKDYVNASREEVVTYEIVFDDGFNNGFAFPCDENGELHEMGKEAHENYDYCMAHPDEFVRYNEKIEYTSTHFEPASGVCSCGEKIELYDQYLGACECPRCGKWYNLFGQELKPPHNGTARTKTNPIISCSKSVGCHVQPTLFILLFFCPLLRPGHYGQ